jgi:hypothetical protein
MLTSTIGLGAISNFLEAAFMGYLSNETLLRYFGITNEPFLIAFSTYVALSSGFVMVVFHLNLGVKNLFYLANKIMGRFPQDITHWPAVILSSLLGFVRMIGQTALTNFVVKGALRVIPFAKDHLSASQQSAIAMGVSVTSMSICSGNRAIQLYRLFSKPHSKDQDHSSSQKSEKWVLFTHESVGAVYLLFFFASYYIGCADVEEQFKFSSKAPGWITFNLFNAACSTMVEYAFTNWVMKTKTHSLLFKPSEDRRYLLGDTHKEDDAAIPHIPKIASVNPA